MSGRDSLVADLQEQLDRQTRELDEARQQQAATSEILRVISSSPTDVQPVFDTIVRSAVRLCDGVIGAVGATPAKNSALTSAGAELRFMNGVSLLAKFDGEFAAHSQTYAGTGTVRYVW